MREDIICAGFGGQGIMFLGKLIAYAAMKEGLHVSWMPSYGAEVRGGTAYSMVVLSDDEIASPIVYLCDTALIMNQPSLDKFITNIKPGGMLILNSSVADVKSAGNGMAVFKIPMTGIAHRLGNIRTANMVALGAYLKNKKLFSKTSVIKGIEEAFSGNKELIDLNIKALGEGLGIK